LERAYLDAHARLVALGLTAAEELLERLEESPEKLSTREVREIMEAALDRSSKVRHTLLRAD